MIRLILIFIITFLMVMDAGAQDRRRGGGDGWRGGGGDRGGYSHRGDRPRYYHAQRPGYRYRQGYGWFDPSAAVGTAVGVGIGSWLWRQWAQPEPPPPPVVVVQQPAPEPLRTVGWCMDRYRSYDPMSRSYLGYDGYRHSCP
jgi:BA14K-like protein